MAFPVCEGSTVEVWRGLMTWVKLDDGFPNNPKVEQLSDKAKLLYVAGLCYCGRNLTDGVLTAAKAVKVVLAEVRATRRHVTELHEAGLWDRLADGWMVHDYLDHNPSREKVMDERRKARDRMANRRGSGERSGEQPAEGSGARSPSPSRPVKDKTLGELGLFTVPAGAVSGGGR